MYKTNTENIDNIYKLILFLLNKIETKIIFNTKLILIGSPPKLIK